MKFKKYFIFLVGIFFLFLLVYFYNTVVLKKTFIKKKASLIFLPEERIYPPTCTDYYDLYYKFMTCNNLDSLEINIENKLNKNICDEYYYLLGRIEEKRKNWNKAIEYYQKASDVFPLRSYFLRIAMIYDKLGNDEEKELAYDKASITLGNIWLSPNYKSSFKSSNLFQSSNITYNALTFNRPIEINKILTLIKNNDLEDAFSEYNQLMKDRFHFHYEYDRLIKIFAPYYYNVLINKLTGNFILSYWCSKYSKNVGSEKIKKTAEGNYILSPEELKISYYYFQLCKFSNKLKLANFSYQKSGKEWKNFLFATNSFIDENYLEIILYKKYDYLSFRNRSNIQTFVTDKFYSTTSPMKHTRFKSAPKKWLNNMIESF